MARFQSRLPASLYVAGPFAMGYTEFYNFLIPLYGLSLGMSAGQIGMLVGARSLLAVFLSIHVGALMDRLGTRRVALFFVWTAMALAPVFPLLPWFWPLLLLQVVNGGALQFAWSGSQTLIAQLAEGEAEYLGRFSFFARIGTTVAPMIAGAAWDFGGAWPAYALGFAWGAALTLALLRAPEAPIATGDGRNPGRRVRLRVVDVLPRLPDYVRCFALMAIPTVATTMAIIFLRTATNGVQSSIYVVYLKGIGLTGTSIGILFAAIEITSGLGSLFAGRAMRLGDPQRTIDLHHTFFRRRFRAAFRGAGVTRLAARGCPADDVPGAGQGRRAASSGLGGRAAADHEPPGGDRHPAADGQHRRPLGRRSELCHSRRRFDRAVRAGHLDHPARSADGNKSGGADLE
jgi:MFS family permease